MATTYTQEIAEQSKNDILAKFAVSVHKVGEIVTNASRRFSVILAVAIFAIALVILIVISSVLVVYEYQSLSQVALILSFILLGLILVLVIAVISSTASMKIKTKVLAYNAVNVLSSEQAIALLNNVAKVYNENIPQA